MSFKICKGTNGSVLQFTNIQKNRREIYITRKIRTMQSERNRYALGINVVYEIVCIYIYTYMYHLPYMYKYILINQSKSCAASETSGTASNYGTQEQEKEQKLQKFLESLPGSKGNGNGNQKRRRCK